MKYIEDSNSSNSADLITIFEKAIMIALEEIISSNFDTSMSHWNSYGTQLLVLFNRGIVLSEEFRSNIFGSQNQEQSRIFLEQWFNKMTLLMLNFARRINQLAIIHILPYLDKEMLAFTFPKMASYVFSAVESDIYIKESKNLADFYSPEKIENYETVSVVKNINSKGSARLAHLRSEDKLMNMGLAEAFITNLQALCMNLQVDETFLLDLLPEEKQKKAFQSLVKSSSKYFKN